MIYNTLRNQYVQGRMMGPAVFYISMIQYSNNSTLQIYPSPQLRLPYLKHDLNAHKQGHARCPNKRKA